MLLNLEVLNGTMSFSFDKYVDMYTVTIENNINNLDLKYEVLDGAVVEVVGNENLDEGLNYVYLNVSSSGMTNTYTLEVYKEKTDVVFNEIYVPNKINEEESMPKYVLPVIIISCFFIIFIFFRLLFHRKKKS